MRRSPVFTQLYSAAELAAMSRSERNKYENSLRYYRDALADIETNRNARKRAKEEGIIEGREMGMKEGMEVGMKEGKEMGMKEGMEKGMEKGHGKGHERSYTQQCPSVTCHRYATRYRTKSTQPYR